MPFMSPPETRSGSPADAAGANQPGRLFNAEDFAVADLAPPEIWNRITTIAVRERASDVHVSFHNETAQVAVRLDGRVCPQGTLPLDLGQRLVNHIKVTANLDPAERRRPQDGRIAAEIDGRMVDLRISLFPTNHGESVAVRVQDREAALLDMEHLGMGTQQLNELSSLIDAPSGLVLVTGPTGAGKTTTLYSLLRRLADGSRKIITVENPIEYDLPGVEQSEVNYKIGVDYASLVRAGLRHDPNILMIGEVRDAETAQAVVRAANSGRLVFATTHAVQAAAAVESLVALGAHPHFVGRSFRGAIAQTLVRRLCPYCTVPLAETADASLLSEVRHLLESHEQPTLSMGRGCPHCRHTGYRGRLGVFEILVANEPIREMIGRGAPAREIYDTARQSKMVTIDQAAKLAALRGLTTIEELIQNVSELWTTNG
ncbi:MAG: GspE/PulE family protein [Phycisphaerae bacterium]|jgi:general secretion pathway protein E